jgi:putative zinc finger/helix-turn-helix YgiT family protein
MIMLKEISRSREECPVCETERDLVYGEIKEVLKVRGEDIEVTTRVHYCPDGDHSFYSINDEEDKFQLAYTEYRKRKGLLQPQEIKQIRETYGLSQRNFARLLGWGEITIHRYETGAIQDDAHNDVLESINSFEKFKEYIERKRRSTDSEIIRRIDNKIIEIERKKNIQAFNLWEKYSITKTKQNFLHPLIRTLMASDYLEPNKYFPYCANEERELAIAA